jgi:hypothetical protein
MFHSVPGVPRVKVERFACGNAEAEKILFYSFRNLKKPFTFSV